MKNIFKSEFGLTLVELIVVVGIMSILAVASIVALDPMSQFQKASDSRRKSDLSQIQKAIESYYQDNGKYPASSISTPVNRILDPGTNPPSTITTIDWGKPWSPYMNLVPQDPSSFKNYVYYSTGQAYYLYASLDRGSKDPQACPNGQCSSFVKYGGQVNVDPSTACGAGGQCNFGVSSPNVSP
jgi:type II secretory pathway pseudopilin PulG